MAETGLDAIQDDEPAPGEVTTPEADSDVAESDTETFSREYVETLRQESAKYRERAKGADELRHRLHDALVKLDGRLADPTDLTYSDENLDDIARAITDLIERKPHLARKPRGDVGQGVRSESTAPTDFSGLFR
ncbi:hypothetical protein A5784_06335 [Mycobacterium sp. 852013-50091_SCH5140682]|uniref:hypothetical protein n=1 Tax=Mycobacterium sp. 852013-50091_SCH5140682 TaxID=1834109 RepID=UPI0007EA546B|nr:hypothetical protein [Mycobacterium sp. 852013-50091_SCH5140682]OBC08991.1 hypothetical protein A5784_06335 [Mycobacterium sp. 852013-50091_SCH5140682]